MNHKLLKCRDHPLQQITRYTLSQPRSFYCQLCKTKPNDKCINFEDVLFHCESLFENHPTLFAGPYDILKYSNLNGDEIIDTFVKQINQLCLQIKQQCQNGIGQYNQWKSELIPFQTQFKIATGHIDLLNTYNSLNSENLSLFYEQFDKFISQLLIQDNQELRESVHRIESKLTKFFDINIFNNFFQNFQNQYQIMTEKIKCIDSLQIEPFCQMLDIEFQMNLQRRIRRTFKFSQIQQIYKGSRDGMHYTGFWSKCQNQGPTLLIAKSKQKVFGLFTPCQWKPNGQYQSDPTGSSFIFSGTHQEIYPLVGTENVICGGILGQGHTFFAGLGYEIYISQNFYQGSSKLGISYAKEGSDIEDDQTHLYGGLLPNIQEMEVYLLK